MLAHNLYYLNFAGRLMLPLCVVVHMEGGKSGNAAAPSFAPPTVPPPQRDLLLTLCDIVGRALFSGATDFLVVAPRLPCVPAPLLPCSFCTPLQYFLAASLLLVVVSFYTNAAVFFNDFSSNFLNFSCFKR
jgi:hypothetical protein